jgi:hypothetical protein
MKPLKKTISRTVPVKDTEQSATSDAPASTPTASSAPDGPSTTVSEDAAQVNAGQPAVIKAVGVILKEEKPVTVTATRQGGASWFIPAQKPSSFGSK